MFSQASVFLSVYEGKRGRGYPSLWSQVLSGRRGIPAFGPRSFTRRTAPSVLVLVEVWGGEGVPQSGYRTGVHPPPGPGQGYPPPLVRTRTEGRYTGRALVLDYGL